MQSARWFPDSSDLEVNTIHRPLWQWLCTALRYTNVTIPQGATIVSAKVQFHVDEVGDNSAGNGHVTVAKTADNAAAFTSSAFNLTTRTLRLLRR